MSKSFLQDTAKTILSSDEVKKPILSEMGNTFAYAWQGTFSFIETWATKKKISQHYALESYKNEIENKYISISPDKLVEPKLEIIGPALEASKYYIENKELRNMFSNLIASSFNSDKTDFVHPSFTEFIKQLSPLDAKIFKELYLNEHTYGVGEVRLNTGNSTYLTLYRTFFPLILFNSSNLLLVQASIDNLIRLGLINVNSNCKFTDDSIYNPIYEHEAFKGIQAHLLDDRNNVYLHKMLWNVTMLGNCFAKTCVL